MVAVEMTVSRRGTTHENSEAGCDKEQTTEAKSIRRPNPMNMWWPALLAVLICVTPVSALGAQSTLLNAWLQLPDLGGTAWPYAFIRLQDTRTHVESKRSDVLHQIDELHWRLVDKGYPDLARAVTQWKQHLKSQTHHRFPGDWSPAWLLAHPLQRPPASRVEAIGVCRMPHTITVWDASGVREIRWRSGLRLSDILRSDPALSGGTTDEVAIVWPQGDIDHYGVAAWNAADTELVPGTRVVGAINLGGSAFPWLRDAIAKLLAHTPSGVDCRHVQLTRPVPQGQ